jgi:hypothetical protein
MDGKQNLRPGTPLRITPSGGDAASRPASGAGQ